MSKADAPSVYTIGHSTRSLEALIDTLRAYGVETLADIRSVPRSRHNPQFNRDVLAQVLPQHSLLYVHLKALGGLRGGARKDSPNTGWRNEGFRAYADYMLTAEFEEGLAALLALAQARRTAIMCAESLPWRCHRSLVADILTARGCPVHHIFDPRKSQPHAMTAFARVEGDKVIYPALI